MLKSLFSGWKTISEEDALDWAKFKFRQIWGGVNHEDKTLEYINSRFKGIKFTIKDLTWRS